MNSLLRCAGFLPKMSASRPVGQSASRAGEAWEEPQGIDTVFDPGAAIDVGSALVGNGPTPVEIGVPAELAQNRPDAASVFFETLAPGRGGLAGVTFALQDNNGNPASLLTMYQFRSTFAARLVQADGQDAYTYGIKSIVIIGAGGAGAADMSYACNWRLIGVAPTASEAANLAQSLVSFVAVMPQDNWDPSAMAEAPGYLGSWALDPSVAEEIAIGTTTGQFPATHSVSANLNKSWFSFSVAQTAPPSRGRYLDCVDACWAREHAAIWAAFEKCLDITGRAGTGAAAICAAGCAFVPPCIIACLTAIGVPFAGISFLCVAGYVSACMGARIGCEMGCK
jgi:hypothetical protein